MIISVEKYGGTAGSAVVPTAGIADIPVRMIAGFLLKADRDVRDPSGK